MNNLASCHAAAGRTTDALGLHEEALAGRRRRLGPDHRDTLWSLSNVADCYLSLGRQTEALGLHEEALSRRTAALGPDHPNTLWSMNAVAGYYRAVGRRDEAVGLLQDLLDRQRRTLGPDHRDTLSSAHLVIDALVALNRPDEAWPRIDAALELADRAAAGGKAPPPTLRADLLALRLRVCRDRKDAAGVRRTAELLQALPNQTAGVLYATAGCHAVLAGLAKDDPAGAKADADRAMTWLTKAVAAGYKDRAHMEKDANLDALRGREDFRTLIGSLPAPAPKP
jgi:tetratricopeptide (TPR) repeat protein